MIVRGSLFSAEVLLAAACLASVAMTMPMHVSAKAKDKSAKSTPAAPIVAKPPKVETRTIQFADRSVGGLYLVPKMQAGNPYGVREFAVAKGKVTVAVPENMEIVLRSNANLINEPQLLDGLADAKIDCLEIKAVFLDDESAGTGDKILEHVKRLTELKRLIIPELGPSDKALSKLKTLKKLQALTCAIGISKGDCFKDMQEMPELTELDISDNLIKSTNYQYIEKFPKLQRLILFRVGLNDEGLKHVVKCSTINNLTIGGNRDITGKSLSYLLQLKDLAILDLTGTTITPADLVQLRVLKHLWRVYASQKYFTPVAVASLAKTLPGVQILVDSPVKPVSKELGRIFAPLK